MQRYMLDTNTASFAIKNNPGVRAKLTKVSPSDVFISVITEAELLFGVERRPDNPKLRQAVEEFLKRINVLSWDTDTAKQYALIRAKLEKVGKPMGNMDILIAAHAVSSGLVLVTNDKVFKNVDNLKIEDWVE